VAPALVPVPRAVAWLKGNVEMSLPTVQPISDTDEITADRAVEQQEHELRQRVLRNPGVRALIGARFTTSLGADPLPTAQ
jgi:hypothetical protein